MGWTKFDGKTYTPLLKVWKIRKQAKNAGEILKNRKKIKSYRTMKYSNPFKEPSLRGYVLFINGKYGSTGDFYQYLK